MRLSGVGLLVLEDISSNANKMEPTYLVRTRNMENHYINSRGVPSGRLIWIPWSRSYISRWLTIYKWLAESMCGSGGSSDARELVLWVVSREQLSFLDTLCLMQECYCSYPVDNLNK